MENTKILFTESDSILNVDYSVLRVNAIELSNYLKSSLANKGINYDEYNSDKREDYWSDRSPTAPVTELYEYQNFFLLEKEGEYILLDGFRRLLWYPVPDILINVRVYKYSDLTSAQILSLMLDLNQFKTIGNSGGAYNDRGFALLLKTVFNLNINTYSNRFDSYLCGTETTMNWNSNRRTHASGSMRERIVRDNFVTDLQFIETAIKAGIMVDQHFTTLIYKVSSEKNLPVFEDFYSEVKKSSILMDLIKKYHTMTNDTGGHLTKTTNKILEMYNNIFDVMNGADVTLSYAEKLDETKKLSATLKKNKELTKLTGIGYASHRALIHYMGNLHNEKKPFPELIILAYPSDSEKHSGLGYGVITDWEVLASVRKKKNIYTGGDLDVYITLKKDNKELNLSDDYSPYGSGKKYTRVTGDITQKIELYAKISKADFKKIEKDYEEYYNTVIKKKTY